MSRPDHVFTDADIQEWLRSKAIGEMPFFKTDPSGPYGGEVIRFWRVIMFLWADNNRGFKGISLRGMPLKKQMKYLKHRAAGLYAAWVNRVETYDLPDSLPILMDYGGTPRWVIVLSENWRCRIDVEYRRVELDPENPHDEGHRAVFDYRFEQRHLYTFVGDDGARRTGEMFYGKLASESVCIPDGAGWLPEDGSIEWTNSDVKRLFDLEVSHGKIVDEPIDRRKEM